jgi:integrase
MAAYRRLPSGLWQVQVFRRGVRKSSSFPSKGAAVAWAGQQEAEIMGGARGEVPNITLAALLARYENEVSVHKKGRKWEAVRLRAMGRDRVALVKLRQLDTVHVADWQKRRLEAVSAASVRRERNLLNNVLEIARKEWKWLAKNPFEGVRRPKDGKARKRIATPAELKALEKGASDRMERVIVWAVETGMRAGEIAACKDVRGRVAYLYDSKNGEAREVPLSERALEVWRDGGFGLTAGSISELFARLCDEHGIKGMTFHDLRATACTRLSKKINPLQLAKMMGWKDLKMAMTYYRESTADIAKLL